MLTPCSKTYCELTNGVKTRSLNHYIYIGALTLSQHHLVSVKHTMNHNLILNLKTAPKHSSHTVFKPLKNALFNETDTEQ